MKSKTDDKILKFESLEEAIEFREIGKGRRFFKVGERVIDICVQEIDRYRYENSNFLVRMLRRSKYINKKAKNMLESRISQYIRMVTSYCVRNNENEELYANELCLIVKKYILQEAEEYITNTKEKDKIIDIKTKIKKEA